MILRVVWDLLRDTIIEWRENKAQRLAAALAYYAMFSLAPLLIILISVAGAVWGEQAAEGQILSDIAALIGVEAARAIQMLLASVRGPVPDALTAMVGAVALVFGASAMFNHLKDSLNTIWDVATPPGHGARGWLLDRGLAFVMVLIAALMGLLSLVVSAALAKLSAMLASFSIGVPFEYFINVTHMLVTWAIVTLLFALLYKFLPDTHIAWRDVWIGSAMTAALFVAGQRLIGLYLGRGPLGTAYGVAGALVVILIWVYYSAMILFFGAEFTFVYANRYGSRVLPAPHAVSLTVHARALQGLLRSDELAAAQDQEN